MLTNEKCSVVEMILVLFYSFVRFWDLMEPQFPVLASPVTGALSCQFSPRGSVLLAGSVGSNFMFIFSHFQPNAAH